MLCRGQKENLDQVTSLSTGARALQPAARKRALSAPQRDAQLADHHERESAMEERLH